MQAGRVNILFFKNWKDSLRLVQILWHISCSDSNADIIHLIGIVLLGLSFEHKYVYVMNALSCSVQLCWILTDQSNAQQCCFYFF